jgi:hypothetical protein
MRTDILLSMALILVVAMTLSGCRSEGVDSPEAGSVRSMKGFELYSWQAEEGWAFALVAGTNRLKTVEEISSPEVRLEGLDALKRELDRLAPGEWVFWSEDRVENTALPAVDVIREVRAYCEQRGLHLEIQAGDVRWDPSPTVLVIRYYSPHTTAGLAGAFDRRYYIPEVQVWGDGRIMWTLHEGAGRRVLEGQLTTGRMEALLQRILDAGFLDWVDEYQTLGGNSYPPMHLSVSLAGRSKEVSEHGGAPDGYYELVGFLTGGAGATGHDYVPARGYLSAAPGPIEADAPLWPGGTVGITLDQVGEGRYVDGESLAFAWQLMNENPKGPVYVRSGGRVYSIMVQIPGVSYFEPPPSGSSSIRYSAADGLVSDDVTALAFAPDGTLWVAMRGGVNRFDGIAWETVARREDLHVGSVRDIVFTPDGAAWMANGFTLARFDGQSWTSYEKLVNSLALAPDGAIWMNGWEGLQGSEYVARFDGESWTTYRSADSYPGGFTVGAVTPDGSVWGITSGRGLASFDGQSWTDGRSWAFYDAADGLPSDQIIDLAVAPDGALWAITAGGIGYFGGRGWKSVELDHSLGAVKAMAFAPDGSIWLGTSKGAAHVHPQPGTNRRHTCTRDLLRIHRF